MGARVEKAGLRAWSEELEEWYVPEYLVRGELHVPLPTTSDRDYLLDAEFVELIRNPPRVACLAGREDRSARIALAPITVAVP